MSSHDDVISLFFRVVGFSERETERSVLSHWSLVNTWASFSPLESDVMWPTVCCVLCSGFRCMTPQCLVFVFLKTCCWDSSHTHSCVFLHIALPSQVSGYSFQLCFLTLYSAVYKAALHLKKASSPRSRHCCTHSLEFKLLSKCVEGVISDFWDLLLICEIQKHTTMQKKLAPPFITHSK